jgi:hypothetical protein
LIIILILSKIKVPNLLLFSSFTISTCVLLWNRIHNFFIYALQSIITTLLIWSALQIIALSYGALPLEPNETYKTVNHFANSMKFLSHLPFILIITTSIIAPSIQLSTNFLFSKTGNQAKMNRSIAYHWNKSRTNNNRKYHNEYIEYD